MNRVRFLSKITVAAGFALALAFTFSACSSDSPSGPSGSESSSSQKSSSSSAYVPPPVPTEEEACNSYWIQVINQIANQCSNATISISPAPSPDQTYGYDCSLTQADVNYVSEEVCPQTPQSTCDLTCANQIAASMGASLQSSAFCNRVAQCGTTCKANYSWCR